MTKMQQFLVDIWLNCGWTIPQE